MTLILQGADIRGFYAELGIALPEWAHTNAPVRCFADPDSHQRDDRNPSASVNTATGVWQCHGCGARGGAYDAALAKGHTPRSAIETMIAHGLIADRAQSGPHRKSVAPPRDQDASSTPVARTRLEVTERNLGDWQAALFAHPTLLDRLTVKRGWRLDAIKALGLGLDRGRITIPIRDTHGLIQGVLRYQPSRTTQPKMLAVPGTRLGLIPHPTAETCPAVMLVEGPPDMIAARSHGLPAIAVPGDHAWRPEWAQTLAGRRITIVMDADDPGRAAAHRIAHDLAPLAQPEVIDLAPGRTDGYDLTDWLLDVDRPRMPGTSLVQSTTDLL